MALLISPLPMGEADANIPTWLTINTIKEQYRTIAEQTDAVKAKHCAAN
jgi:hypothetical protein